MFNKRSLPLVLVFVLAGFLIAFGSNRLINPPDKYQVIFTQVAQMLEVAHYSPKKIDDDFSKNIFKKYIESLDPNKDLFLLSDINELKKYETSIDNELHGAPIEFFYAVENIYRKRVAEVNAFYPPFLQTPFQFTTDENILLNPDKLDFPKTDLLRKELWKKRLKFMVLEKYAELLDVRDQLKKGDTSFKSDAVLEKEARDKVKLSISKNFDRIIMKTKENERFDLLVNNVTEYMDPHTTFFPPLEKRSFDEQMSGRFFGIGASLRNDENGAIKIASLVPGLPAWKSQQILVGDQVLKVAQGNEAPVDLTGYETTEAVKLIRGKKGTEVRLTLKKADGTITVVSMIREEVELEETYAKSAVLQDSGKKIGYIFLPEFYADWERPNGARSAQDVAKEIIKLKEQNIDGMIIDLRNNGGGSLSDVVQMVGFFIPDGPIVQVKDRNGNPTVLTDGDRSALYDGPLAVMVNEFSASASEIFAAAIQDYGRGLIIGSTSTYGKGTVQKNIGLDPGNGWLNKDNNDIGSLKLTLQKFYRINGGSTQLKGVTPNIILPDQYENMKYREKDNPDALPWDEIPKANYPMFRINYDSALVKQKSKERVAANSIFNAIKENSAWTEKMNQRLFSLNLVKYRAEQKKIRESFKKIDDAAKTLSKLQVDLLPSDSLKLSIDKDKLERRKQWINNLSKDLYINESTKVVSDMIRLDMLVRKSA